MNPLRRLSLSSVCLVLLLAINASPITQSNQTNKTAATEAFTRLKKLVGKWQCRSTKGWSETVVFHTIAGESVVVEDSFDAHPNERDSHLYFS